MVPLECRGGKTIPRHMAHLSIAHIMGLPPTEYPQWGIREEYPLSGPYFFS